jgi:hypothetical protein
LQHSLDEAGECFTVFVRYEKPVLQAGSKRKMKNFKDVVQSSLILDGGGTGFLYV